MDGIIVIHKPKDFTSFDVVAVMRGVTHERKAGHTGTLDPMATGVLPLLFGNATKAQSLLPDSSKEYTADFKLGITTDTLDITGKITSEKSADGIQQSRIEELLPKYTGDIMQLPPMYSAVQQNGKRLYDLARQGIQVERTPRPVTIHSLELLSYNSTTACGTLRVSCSKGTYIRTLIDDIGSDLGCGGTLTALCRTTACGYTLTDSITIEQAKEMAANGTLQNAVMPIESLFVTYPSVTVTAPQAKRFDNGGELDIGRTPISSACPDKSIYRVKAPDEEFLGLGITDSETNTLKILKRFNVIR